MGSSIARLLLALAALVGATLPLSAHGGAYTPVGWGLPIPGNPGNPTTGAPSGPGPMSGGAPGANPKTGGDPLGDLLSWRDWWHFNQDGFLDLRNSIEAASVRTGSDGPANVLRTLLAMRPSRAQVHDTLVPALARILRDERSNELATAALLALARVGDPQPAEASASLVPLLRARLTDASQEVSETAALALGVLGDESALATLEDLCADGERGRALLAGRSVSTRTRAFAAYGLGLLADGARNNRVRQLVARALLPLLDAGARPPPVDLEVATVVALSLDRLDLERGEAQSAAWVSRQSLVHALLEIERDPQRRALARAHALSTLTRLVLDAPAILRDEVRRELLVLLRRERALENEVVQCAVQAAGLLADADADELDGELRAALVRELDDADQSTRFFAAIALGEAGAHAGHGERAEEGRAQCRNALVNELLRGRSRLKPWAALALGVQEFRVREGGGAPSDLARSALLDWTRAQNSPEELGAGAIALALARAEAAPPLLREKLAASGPTEAQGFLALALGMLGTTEAIPQLRSIAKGARFRPWVLEPAAEGLALLGDHELQSELLEALRDSQSLALQASLAHALGLVADARALEPLLALAKSESSSSGARAAAVIALGMLAERGDRAWYVPLARDRNYRAVTPTLLGGDGQGLLEIF